jgi:membrane protease YdiL (CAAX protease family)
VFRGILLTALLGHATAPRWAVVILGAAVFASCHGVHDGWHLARLMTGGTAYGCVYVKTRSVPLCVVCHALWNGLACCPVMWYGG